MDGKMGAKGYFGQPVSCRHPVGNCDHCRPDKDKDSFYGNEFYGKFPVLELYHAVFWVVRAWKLGGHRFLPEHLWLDGTRYPSAGYRGPMGMEEKEIKYFKEYC